MTALLHELTTAPWAMEPKALQALIDRARAGLPSAAAAPSRVQRGAIAVVPIYGIIRQRGGGFIDELLHGASTSTEGLGRQMQSLAADDGVEAIVLDVNSPGGSVFGVEEAADIVFDVARRKPVIAVANATMASAAYWIASQASSISITPSGVAGSIGVIGVHEDVSRMADGMGLTVTVISAGKYKAERNEFEPLADEARAAIQHDINVYYDVFVRAVARGRGVTADAVRKGFGEGRMLTAKDAVRARLVDRVETLRAATGRLSSASPKALRALAYANRHQEAEAELTWQALSLGPEFAAGLRYEGQDENEIERERLKWAALAKPN